MDGKANSQHISWRPHITETNMVHVVYIIYMYIKVHVQANGGSDLK